MISFDITQLHVTHEYLKMASVALGGSISVVDDVASTPICEVYKRIPVPMAVARRFIKKHSTGRYFSPVLVSVTYYGDQVVAIERYESPRDQITDDVDQQEQDESEWFSCSEKHIDEFIVSETRDGEWFIDGTFIYRFNDEPSQWLSSDKMFGQIPVDAIKIATIADTTVPFSTNRNCLAFYQPDQVEPLAISPPIWSTLSTFGDRQSGGSEDGDDQAPMTLKFDGVDDLLMVNVTFVLKAAKDLSAIFGYDIIEPLNLPSLMIKLNTVNIPKVQQQVKTTTDSELPFTHAAAWLLGLSTKIHTLAEYQVIRSLLKYLTTRGIYLKSKCSIEAMYHENIGPRDVVMIPLEVAAKRGKDAISTCPLTGTITYRTVTDLFDAE